MTGLRPQLSRPPRGRKNAVPEVVPKTVPKNGTATRGPNSGVPEWPSRKLGREMGPEVGPAFAVRRAGQCQGETHRRNLNETDTPDRVKDAAGIQGAEAKTPGLKFEGGGKGRPKLAKDLTMALCHH